MKKFALLPLLLFALWAISSCDTKPPKATQLEVLKSSISLTVNEKADIEYKVTPEKAQVQFSSENPEIATVCKGGVVTAKKVGETYIVLTAQSLQAKVKVTVLESLSLQYTSKAVLKGDTFTLPVESRVETFQVTVDRPDVVEVNGTQVTAKGEGTATLKIKGGDKELAFTVGVFPKTNHDNATLYEEFLLGDPMKWSIADVLSAEKELGFRENVGFEKVDGKDQLLFIPKPEITAEKMLFGPAIYFLNQGALSRAIYNCVNYPVVLPSGGEIGPLTEKNADFWEALFLNRYPNFSFVMHMNDPYNEGQFYGILFSNSVAPLQNASISLMMPIEAGKQVTHFVVSSFGPAEE